VIPAKVQAQLKAASNAVFRRRTALASGFTSHVCRTPWDDFIQKWAPVCYAFVAEALGPYAVEPLRTILTISDGAHSGGANASFEPGTGQIRLCPSIVEGKPGITLEKLTHELMHASLNDFPAGDPFYEESVVDYGTWTLAHAPIWGMYRESMIKAAAFNIACRRDRAMRDLSDYDRKRWAGGVFCSAMHGPWIIAKLKMRKQEGNYQW